MKVQIKSMCTAFFVALVCLLQAQKATNTPKKTYKISGKITQTSLFCGGARPTEEMMREMEVPKPYKNKVLYVRAGKINTTAKSVLLKFTADSAGSFSFTLPPGEYVIIQAEQVKKLNLKKLPSGKDFMINKKCLDEWWKKPYYALVIKDADVTNLNFNFEKRCFIPTDVSCIEYMGPMPP
jgi:hypothetical protein